MLQHLRRLDWDLCIAHGAAKRHALTWIEVSAPLGDRGKTVPRTHQIADDRDVSAFVVGNLAHEFDQAMMILVAAVGQVEAKHVDACPEELPDHLAAATGWPEGGDNFGSSHGSRSV